MAKILIAGYYGFGNLGDELLLKAIVQEIRQTDPEGEITVLSARPAETGREFGVRTIHRTEPLGLLRGLRRCSLLLFGGGTLLQDATSRRSLGYYLSLLSLARHMGKPVMLYAQGIGPLLHPGDQRRVARALEQVQTITLRDRDSELLLRKMGVKKPALITADPVLGLGKRDGERDERRIGWVLCGGGCGERALTVLEEAMAELNRRGFVSVLLPFYPRQDSRATERLSGWGQVIPAGQIEREIGRCDLVVSMRLHGLILGAAQKSRVLSLSRDPKAEGFLRDMGLPAGLAAEEMTAEGLANAVLDLAKRAEEDRLITAQKALEENRRQLALLLRQ
ncbi:MAG: polysaccharide pyruvyl transferase CsaB [Oscillospiraceae bacterium]|nr:polysaccharide pyruvyl transferase CsaB [Oscillospiraceae bacterium]